MTREEAKSILYQYSLRDMTYPKEDIDAFEVAIKALEQEQKTGHWITHFDDLFPGESTMECSECGEHQPITIDDNYCPNCGAKMEQEEVNG